MRKRKHKNEKKNKNENENEKENKNKIEKVETRNETGFMMLSNTISLS